MENLIAVSPDALRVKDALAFAFSEPYVSNGLQFTLTDIQPVGERLYCYAELPLAQITDKSILNLDFLTSLLIQNGIVRITFFADDVVKVASFYDQLMAPSEKLKRAIGRLPNV